jgi:2-methylisocitrate lyase-like PEP mutase family enzyme
MVMNYIQQFKELHQSEEILFLGNAWDVHSALALEKAGFKAIGTTSGGIAKSFGYGDGEQIDFDVHLGVIKSIVNHVKIPVSADIEAGYGKDTATIIDNVLRTANLGVAGINIEDSPKNQTELRELVQHCDLLSKTRTALEKNGFKDFYINARVDTLFKKQGLTETIDRAKAYVESGASGVFVPLLREDDEIRAVAAQVSAPLNVASLAGLTSINKLKELGVKRLSLAGALFGKIHAILESTASQIYASHDTSLLYKHE